METTPTRTPSETNKAPMNSSYKTITLALSRAEIDPDKKLKTDIPEVKAWLSDIAASNIKQGEQIGAISMLNDIATNDITKLNDLINALKTANAEPGRLRIIETELEKIQKNYRDILKSSDSSREATVELRRKLTVETVGLSDQQVYMRESHSFQTKNQLAKSRLGQLDHAITQIQKDISALLPSAIATYRTVYNPDDRNQPHPATFEGAVITKRADEKPSTITGPSVAAENTKHEPG